MDDPRGLEPLQRVGLQHLAQPGRHERRGRRSRGRRSPAGCGGLNTPYWFNKRDIPKTAAGEYFINDVRLQTPGFRVGGPILKDKLFYFFNYEEFRLPESRSRTRYMLNTGAQQGIFTYPAADGSGNKTVNLLRSRRPTARRRRSIPSIAKLLADIRSATATTGGIKIVQPDRRSVTTTCRRPRRSGIFPTVRLDYNLTASHRLTFSARYNDFNSTPDFLNSAESAVPGLPEPGGPGVGALYVAGHGAVDVRQERHQRGTRRRAGRHRTGDLLRPGRRRVAVQLHGPRLPERRADSAGTSPSRR